MKSAKNILLSKSSAIVISSFFGHCIVYGTTWSVGIFSSMFQEAFQDDDIVLFSWIGTINTAAVYAICPLSNLIMSKLGYKWTTIIGGCLSSLGLGISSYAYNSTGILLSFSVLTGIGLGISYIPIISIVSVYCDIHRSIAVGISVSGVGMGTFIYPCMVSILTNYYGWRNALLLLSGITMNLVVIGCIINEPVQFEKSKSIVKNNSILPCTKLIRHQEQSTESHEVFLFLYHIWLFISRKLHFNLFKSFDFLILCFNNVLVHGGFSIVLLFLNRYSESKGNDNLQNSFIVSIFGIFNIFGRISFGLLKSLSPLTAVNIYSTSLSIFGLFVFIFPFIEHYVVMIIVTGIFGLLSSPSGCLLPDVVVEIAGLKSFNFAFSYLMIFEAIGFLVFGPLASVIYASTKSYYKVFGLGSIFLIVGNAPMIIPWRTKSLNN